MPVSVLEAMAFGLCVVSTEVGGVPELIQDGVSGLLVPPRSPQAMVAAVLRLVRDPALAARVSHNARELAASRDWGRLVPPWERLLEDILTGAPQA
jgi:glycosyltransferase involved in cell wall biosynthesis